MNAEFYINLTKMKTLENASFIESIKDIYFKCEQKAQFESCGTISDTQKETFYENGSVRCTRVSDGIIVEASAVGTKNLYGVVAVVSKGTSLEDAMTTGKCALDNPIIMEGLMDGFLSKLKKFASIAALSIAPFLVACAGGGHQPTIDQTVALNADTIPEMVQAFSQKIREEANNVKDYNVTQTPSGQEAQEIYAALMNGTMKVNVEGDEEVQREAAQKAATAFARGLDQELRAKQKLPGSENMFKAPEPQPVAHAEPAEQNAEVN